MDDESTQIFIDSLFTSDKYLSTGKFPKNLTVGIDTEFEGSLRRDLSRGTKLAASQLNKEGGIIDRRVKVLGRKKNQKNADVLIKIDSANGANRIAVETGLAEEELYAKEFRQNYSDRYNGGPNFLAGYSYDLLTGVGTTLNNTTWTYNFTGGMQQWTSPEAGSYTITAKGAIGGNNSLGSTPGTGAIIAGTFTQAAGFAVDILVGGQGETSLYGGGGGGGSFVVSGNDGSPIVVAGGGGGVGPGYGGENASLTTSGTADFSGVAAGGTDGSGGTIGADSKWYGGAGGGGLTGNGGTHYNGSVKPKNLAAQGGFAFIAGGNGGIDGPAVGDGLGGGGGNGGYGGGGAGGWNGTYDTPDVSARGGGGGGGGYSGGGGGYPNNFDGGGGGGGSFLNSKATNSLAEIGNASNGQVGIVQVVVSERFRGSAFKGATLYKLSINELSKKREEKFNAVRGGRVKTTFKF